MKKTTNNVTPRPTYQQMSSALLEAIHHNNDLREKMALLIKGLLSAILLCVLLVILAGGLIYAFENKKVIERYLIEKPDGTIVSSANPLTNPLTNAQAIADLSDECIRATFNIDFIHYREQIDRVRYCYTEEGYEEIREQMKKKGAISEITTGYNVGRISVLNPVAVSKPRWVAGERIWSVVGVYRWTLTQNEKKVSFDMLVQTTIKRVSLNKNIKGAAIDTVLIRLQNQK